MFVSSPLGPINITLYDRRDFAGANILTEMQKMILDYEDGPNVNTGCL